MDPTAIGESQSVTDNSTEPVPESGPPDADIIIAKYEEMFTSRYTPEDPAYIPYLNKGMDPPPVVENYHIRRQRQNWNDNSRDQRHNQDGGYKRSYGDTGWRGGTDRPKRQYDNRDYRQQGRGWGHSGQQGQQGQQWGHQPRQDWRGRGGQGQSSRPPWERQHDDRDRGRPLGSHEPSHGSQGRNSSRSDQDEWT